MNILESYYRIPSALASPDPSLAHEGSDAPRAAEAIKAQYVARHPARYSPAELAAWVRARLRGSRAPAGGGTPLTTVVDDLRLERYQPNATAGRSIRKSAYYAVRPLLGVSVRKHLQRLALRDWQRIAFPEWPVDTTVETILEAALAARLAEGEAMPFIWFWPHGHDGCVILTHDVETAEGRDACGALIDMEQQFGIRSSFEVVPEQRYEVTSEYLAGLRERGCEVCLHGLNHDYRLFTREDLVVELAKRVNEYLARYEAIGFRSPVMYRNVDWFKYFDFKYDMSLPNVAHLDPQRGGCCTVMPYAIGDVVELPTTTIQDYALFHTLGRRDMGLWEEQIARILEKHGLISFIIHPDYTTPAWARALFGRLLERLERLRAVENVWIPLPRDVYRWWVQRTNMRLVNDRDTWRIEGEGSERASVGWIRLDGAALVLTRQPPGSARPD
jgi:hypothetical protein